VFMDASFHTSPPTRNGRLRLACNVGARRAQRNAHAAVVAVRAGLLPTVFGMVLGGVRCL
jgi:hypothetical protein